MSSDEAIRAWKKAIAARNAEKRRNRWRSPEKPVTGVRWVPPPSFLCPRCHLTSYNENDVREGYCGNCRDWTRVPAGGNAVPARDQAAPEVSWPDVEEDTEEIGRD